MQIDYVSVFERLRKKDILYGGNNNFAIKKEIEPFINFEDSQSMGVLPSFRRMAFVCEKWRQPKKAPRARGDGCGASST